MGRLVMIIPLFNFFFTLLYILESFSKAALLEADLVFPNVSLSPMVVVCMSWSPCGQSIANIANPGLIAISAKVSSIAFPDRINPGASFKINPKMLDLIGKK